MHKVSLAITFLVVLLIIFLVASEIFSRGGRGEVLGSQQKIAEQNLVEDKEERAAVFNELKKYPYTRPMLLSLDFTEGVQKLPVENVGLDSVGELQTPNSWNNVGWYVESAKVGQKGLVIIDGHYDTDTGAPAAFWRLKNANLNDKVLVEDELGRVFTYKVVDKSFVDIQDPQRQQVFQESDKPELLLITCGGVWNEVEGTYNKRLVVKAELVL